MSVLGGKNKFKIIIILLIIISTLTAVFLEYRNFFDFVDEESEIFQANVDVNTVKYWTQDNFYIGLTRANQDERVFVDDIVAAVIPHHLLVSDLISNFFENLGRQKPDTIIIVGPDHYDADTKGVITGINKWSTEIGEIEVNGDIVEGLSKLDFVEINDSILENEHSVSSHIPFIKYYIDDAKIVPIVIKNDAKISDLEKLSDFLSNIIDDKNVLISSVDFSHYLSSEEAETKDIETLEIMRNYNYENLLELNDDNVDSPRSIFTLFNTVEKNNIREFDIFYHLNSSDVLDNYNDEVTSYFFLLFYNKEKEKINYFTKILENILDKEKEVRITFLGDLMVDRQIRRFAEEKGYDFLFKEIKEKLSESDLVIANLEGPVTDFQSIYKDSLLNSSYTFTFDPEVLNSMFESNIKMVYMDNNHITNFGKEGVEQTIKKLEEKQIDYFGYPYKREASYKEINGLSFAFISYNQFLNPDSDTTINLIKDSRSKSDFVIVYTHWGDEYVKNPNSIQVNLARSFVDNGADLVIGTHPHVIQNKEKYKGKYIYYSLGNFIFDQYFSDDVKCGAVVNAIFNSDKSISISENFVELSPESIVNFSDCLDFVPTKF